MPGYEGGTMKTTALAAIAAMLLVSSQTVFAAAYDDFNRGLSANLYGEPQKAIASFTAALEDGGLVATYIPEAYLGRASAYLTEDKCSAADADLNEAAQLASNDIIYDMLRAAANECLHKLDQAQKAFEAAVALRRSSAVYFSFAYAQWHAGDFSQAAGNFAQAEQLANDHNPQKPYFEIWYALSAARGGTLDDTKLEDGVSALDSSDWPMPLLQLFLGKMTIKSVYGEAKDADEPTRTGQMCEANFYIGEWQIVNHQNVAAKTSLLQAINECPHSYHEYAAAQVEMKRHK